MFSPLYGKADNITAKNGGRGSFWIIGKKRGIFCALYSESTLKSKKERGKS